MSDRKSRARLFLERKQAERDQEQNDLAEIGKVVAKASGVPLSEIIGYSRKPKVVDARDCVAHIATEEGFTASAIARFLRKDHTTVLAMRKRISDTLEGE